MNFFFFLLCKNSQRPTRIARNLFATDIKKLDSYFVWENEGPKQFESSRDSSNNFSLLLYRKFKNDIKRNSYRFSERTDSCEFLCIRRVKMVKSKYRSN